MAGFLWYKDRTYLSDAEWNQFSVGEVADVSYTDVVYKPAVFEATIQNISAGGGLGHSLVAHNTASTRAPIIVTKSSHGLNTTDRISVSADSTGQIIPRIYEVEKIDGNTFYIRHFAVNQWSGQKEEGSEVNRILGQVVPANGTLTYTPTGKYSIESSSVANPDLTMGLEIIYWHMPDEFNSAGPFAHNGASPLVVTDNGHGYRDFQIIQVLDETSGAIEDNAYQVVSKTTNTYQLRHVKSSVAVNGTGTSPATTGTLRTYVDNNATAFPLFYGTITSLEESWSPSYGKIIKLQAKDHLQFFNNTTVKKLQIRFRDEGELIGGPAQDVGEQYHMGSELEAPIYLDGKKGYYNTASPPVFQVTETKVSDAIGNMVSDFNEGAGLIYTDNLNGSIGASSAISNIGQPKFEDSGFEMSMNELASGMFKRDLADSGHKVLRAMQDMAMADRHVTAVGTHTGKVWSCGGSGSPIAVAHTGHGLTTSQQIAVKDSTSASGMYVANGYYTVEVINSGAFYLLTMAGERVVGTASVSSGPTLTWEGAEDGNFGYDFFLDVGMYGQPNVDGYRLTGDSVDLPPRPMLNYFKRGYLQFRPDATGLNIVSPTIEDAEETGQTRIMTKNASWKIGDDEIISDVDLSTTATDEGNSEPSDLGHNLQLLRVKKMQCCNNVDAVATALGRLNHGGRWNGEFHWNRHDSFTRKSYTDSVEKYETVVGVNDEAMFCKSSGDLTSPGFSDTSTSSWEKSVLGNALDYWAVDHASTATGYTSTGAVVPGTPNDLEILRRVLVTGMGGINVAGAVPSTATVSVGTIPGGGHRVSGYAGISQVPMTGRPLQKGPGEVAVVAQYTDNNPVEADQVSHRYPHYSTGIVDCDLIKSIQNCELEGFDEANNFAGYATVTDSSGSMLVNHITSEGGSASAHYLQTGAMIKITAGESYDSTNYWNNYKRVEMDGVTPDINATTGRNAAASFYHTNLPNEAYDGITGTIPTAGALTKMAYVVGGITAYKRVFNVFDGVCRVQYQASKTRTESPTTDSYVLISDRSRLDKPYMGVEVHAIADEDRKSSTTYLTGLTTGKATMPDSLNYSGGDRLNMDTTGLRGGLGKTINGVNHYTAMPVRFRTGDKISETRFLMKDEPSPTSKHLFKNTQAIITNSLMEDKKRAKTSKLTYAAGNDFNEIRRTAASLLTRAAKDLIRGTVNITRYPFITLTGVADTGSGSPTGATLIPTQNVPVYGGRPGMLVTKTNGLDGTFMAGVLAEQFASGAIKGTLNTGSWSPGDHYRMYIHLRAGHSVRVSDPLSSVASNAIITKIEYKQTPSSSTSALEVIGYQDLPTGSPVMPLGDVTKAVVDNKGDLAGPITLGKARLNEITFSAGEP